MTRWIHPENTKREYDSCRGHVHHWEKCVLIIDTFDLLISASYKAGFVAFDATIGVQLQFEDKTG
jgi:hypothetical protein